MVSTSPLRPPHLTTAADKGQAAIERHAATIRKLKEQERDITEQHEKLQFMIEALESRRQAYMELEFQHTMETRSNDSPPARLLPTETPGPHRHI
jgi:acyl-CoA reductase-like NAD-dependent aldehyde dehydrogenase